MALATPTTTPRKTKMALKRDWRGRLWLLLCCVAPLQTPFYLHKLFLATLETPFYLHKLFLATRLARILSTQTFLATPLHPMLSRQTFARNSCTPDCIYTNFCSQLLYPRFYLHKRFLGTPPQQILSTRSLSRNSSAPRQRPATAYIGTFQ